MPRNEVLGCEQTIYEIQALAQASFAMAGCEVSEPMEEAQRRVALMISDRINAIFKELFPDRDWPQQDGIQCESNSDAPGTSQRNTSL